jgi:hypothetical protein
LLISSLAILQRFYAWHYKCFQRFGPDEVFFRVTGIPDPQLLNKGNPDENFDIMINFDVQNNDPDTVEKKLQQFVQLNQLNANGRLNVDALLDVAAASIDPVMADAVLQPVEDAQQQIVKDVTDDLAKIFAGIEMPARPSGAQIAMQVIQQYAQQPDVAQRLQTGPSLCCTYYRSTWGSTHSKCNKHRTLRLVE